MTAFEKALIANLVRDRIWELVSCLEIVESRGDVSAVMFYKAEIGSLTDALRSFEEVDVVD